VHFLKQGAEQSTLEMRQGLTLDFRNSITHNATVMAHGLMQCGTTSDVFLRAGLSGLGA